MEKREQARGGVPYVDTLFEPGERHVVKGKLFFGEDGKSLDFEKEFRRAGKEIVFVVDDGKYE